MIIASWKVAFHGSILSLILGSILGSVQAKRNVSKLISTPYKKDKKDLPINTLKEKKTVYSQNNLFICKKMRKLKRGTFFKLELQHGCEQGQHHSRGQVGACQRSSGTLEGSGG